MANVLAFLVAVLAAASAQQSAPPPGDQQPRPPTIRTGTNLVRVDVTVLDRRGDPVKDLRAEEVEIEEDGVVQPIRSFQLVQASGFPGDGDEDSLPIRSMEHARAEAAREDVRVFLIFWDEYHLHPFVSSITARQALSDFVLHAFGPRDLVAIMDPLTPTEAIRFSRDRRELADAVARLIGRRGVYVPARSVMEEELLRRPRDIERVRYEVTMTALKAAAVYLGTLREGRKSIVFVSEGVWRGGAAGTPLQREVTRAANEHNTAIYTVDPRGLGPRPSDMLIDLANATGGQAIVNTNAPARLLPQIVKHASAYYLLGYAAENSPADGKFHKIRVRVKRPDVDVRSRGGYWAPTVGQLARAYEAASAPVKPLAAEARAAIAAGSARRSIDLWVGSAQGEGGSTNVTLAWAPHANGRDASLQAVAIQVTALGPDGREFFQSAKLDTGTVTFAAPAGLMQLNLSVLDAGGVVLERDTRRISVPNFAKPTLSVSSPVLLRARTAVELKALLADPDAPPFIGREFHRSERLLVRFEVYGSGAGEARVAARLMTRSGGTLVALPVTAVAERPGRYQIDLPLGATARGEFMIAIEASGSGEQVQSVLPLRVVG